MERSCRLGGAYYSRYRCYCKHLLIGLLRLPGYALAALFPAWALAGEESLGKPWWLEFGLGRGEVEVVGHDRRTLVSELLAEAGVQAEVLDAGEPDDTNTRTLGAGYRFSPYFGIELAYHDLGSTEGHFIAQRSELSAGTISGTLSSDYRALSASAIGYWPLQRWFALQVKLGIHHWRHEFRVHGTYPGSSAELDERRVTRGNNMLFGAGLGLFPLSWLGLDIYWERFQGVENEPGIDVKSVRAVIKLP